MKDSNGRHFDFLLPVILLTLFLVMRLPALGRFVTTDEALWLRRSANFYLAFSNGEWEKTFQSPHPGVVTLWAGAAGFQLAFPEYSRVGYESIHDLQLLTLMENRGLNPVEVLATSRLVLVLVNAAVFLAAWPYTRRVLGLPAAALGMALLALDPFTIAHQRLLHLDGLLASFMLLAVLAYLDHLRDGKLSSLAVSGIAAGFAWLTKTPAWFLLPFIVALSIFFWWKASPRKSLISNLQSLLLWFGIALLVTFLFFPALWTDPLSIPAQMANYALGSAEGEYSGPVFFNGVVYPEGDLGSAGWIFYPLAFLWRSTPLVLIGLVLILILFYVRHSEPAKTGIARRAPAKNPPGSKSIKDVLTGNTTSRPTDIPTFGLLFLFSIAFILFMTIAGKKFDRYLMPALPPLILIAGWGWSQFAARLKWLQSRQWRATALLMAVAALQLVCALPTFPYYLSYYNSLMGGSARAPEVMMIGWGEGLDQAADYLNRQPNVQPGDAAAWYSVSFNLLTSAAADDIPIELQLPQGELGTLLAKEYLVIYIHQWQRGTPQNLLNALATLDPEFRVNINGIEYVRVYHLMDN